LNPLNFVKTGSGTQILTGNNSATPGAVTVSAGVLEVDNSSGSSGLPTGPVTVAAGATLDGTGSVQTSSTNNVTINGSLTVGDFGDTSGATFTLGNTGSGGLVVNTNASVNVNLYSGAGSGNNSGNPSAADVLVAQCPVTLSSGSILNVGNPNAMTDWAAGDQWTIANWSSPPTNTFTVLNLPVLPATLAWTLTNFYTNGIIAIVSSASGPTEPADILGFSLSGSNLVINGTNLNGGSSFHYLVLISTDLSLPVSQWASLATNGFNTDGTFSFTNPINASQPSTFYTVKAVP
jgi:autotransporter-associated beta strand protein